MGWARQALIILLRSIGHSHIDWYYIGMATPIFCGGMGIEFSKKGIILGMKQLYQVYCGFIKITTELGNIQFETVKISD